MNWDQIEGKWEQFSGKVREKWGKLTNSDIAIIKGKRDQLIGKLRERYGMTVERAQQEIDEFCDSDFDSCGCGSKPIDSGTGAHR